ncbi:Bug family tripartite tricarboxylate transporter substrate binding protein [Modestobacter sp. VKM Ac-2985]|uniref:Bug family tripartite tricarboxylate transporter substrate binding protein n=1 Tax=Modestobacter sp. VKM Ac-2985 TaxID=3004139 RepID=UPI0022ABAF10|nr:tripartite tricarboxylate transporter substrate binding protein [Modestobacter sp. VKM Ac-2985]MCZ2839187.1 tripartite tricarboxylate transporter substrate binding protein [Modestobacter sp. VKM Ac-2985]
MPRRRILSTLGGVVVAALALTAFTDAARSGEGQAARSSLTLVAPAGAGGGWDLVAREAQQAMRTDSIVNTVQVVNIPGAGGTIGLSQLVGLDGEGTTMMVTGTVMLGGISQAGGDIDLQDTTPIARLAEDFEVIAVPADSPFETFDDFLQAWAADPAALPIGGGSAGGIDHMVAAQIAQASGIPVEQVQYTAHPGGGELTLSLLSTAAGTVGVGISGYNDFRDLIESGQLRVLAVVAPERLEGVDAPTMEELGLPEVDLVNWRGLVAPDGITDEERDELEQITREMVQTESWAEAVDRNRWVRSELYGEEFEEFLVQEQDRIDALLDELELS